MIEASQPTVSAAAVATTTESVVLLIEVTSSLQAMSTLPPPPTPLTITRSHLPPRRRLWLKLFPIDANASTFDRHTSFFISWQILYSDG